MAQPQASDQAPALVTLIRTLAAMVLALGGIIGFVIMNETGEGVAAIAGVFQGLLGFAVLMGLAFMCDMLDQIRENTRPKQ
jgi:hypothetical protein